MEREGLYDTYKKTQSPPCSDGAPGLSSDGCGQGKPTSEAPSSSKAGTESTESLKASALKFDWNEDLDLSGRELTISTWGAVPDRDKSEYFERRYIRSDRTEEKYGVKIKWLPVPDTTKFVQDVTLAFLSGKKYADLMFCTSFYGFDLAKLGAIIPLDDYIDYGSSYYSVNGDLLKYVDGLHYSYFPDEFSPSSHGFAVIYNTMLTEAVLDPSEDPMTLYKEGKWDWAAFENVVKKTTKTNSSGEVTQWGVGGGWLLGGPVHVQRLFSHQYERQQIHLRAVHGSRPQRAELHPSARV